jgi:hypothetical protein
MWTHHRRRVDGGRAMNDLARARSELAAVLRWSARLKYQQGVCNHFSIMAPGSDSSFLVKLDREEPEYAG